jgi:hypothetical protein
MSDVQDVSDDSCQHIDDNPPIRTMYGTPIYHAENPTTVRLLVSAVWKMTQVTRDSFDHPFENICDRIVICLREKSHSWARLKSTWRHHLDLFPSPQVRVLYLIEDLGHGAEGRAWLAAAGNGSVCVLKFSERDLDKELRMWHDIYPEFKDLVCLGYLFILWFV